MFDLKAFLANFPALIQYVIVIGLVLLIIYAALMITRFIGSKMGGDMIYFDDPEAYDKSVPDLFAWTSTKRKKKAKDAKQADPDPKD